MPPPTAKLPHTSSRSAPPRIALDENKWDLEICRHGDLRELPVRGVQRIDTYFDDDPSLIVCHDRVSLRATVQRRGRDAESPKLNLRVHAACRVAQPSCEYPPHACPSDAGSDFSGCAPQFIRSPTTSHRDNCSTQSASRIPLCWTSLDPVPEYLRLDRDFISICNRMA